MPHSSWKQWEPTNVKHSLHNRLGGGGAFQFLFRSSKNPKSQFWYTRVVFPIYLLFQRPKNSPVMGWCGLSNKSWVKMSKRCQIVKKMSNVKSQTATLKRRFIKNNLIQWGSQIMKSIFDIKNENNLQLVENIFCEHIEDFWWPSHVTQNWPHYVWTSCFFCEPCLQLNCL